MYFEKEQYYPLLILLKIILSLRKKEIQSEYYHSDHVSILVHIMYRHAELDVNGFDSNENNHEVIKEYHFYISDDCTHDTCFVQHFFGMLYKELSRRKVTFKEHWVWSDGCAGQFKSALSFLWLSCLHRNKDVCHTWIFFETRHGKGEHDGVGACVKHALRRYQMNHSASHLANSNDVVNWCKQNLSHEFNERMGNVRSFL